MMPDRTQHIDYEAAVKARAAFGAADRALMTAGNNAVDVGAAMRLGYVAEACAAAEAAIFNALNVMASYLGDQEAERVVHMRRWEEPKLTYAGMEVTVDPSLRPGTAFVTGHGGHTVTLVGTEEPAPPAFVTESVERCISEVERALEKATVIANAKVGTVHGTSDGGWRVEVRVNDQVFAPRFDTLDKATEYRREVAEIVERAA